MFDIGFSEIVVIAIVALLVVGPEKLPSLVKTSLIYIRKIRAGFNNIRDEVEKELELDEIKKDFDVKNFNKVIGYDELQESLTDLKKESESFRNIAKDSYEYADEAIKSAIDGSKKNIIDNVDIDTNSISNFTSNDLDGEEEADTPIEMISHEVVDSQLSTDYSELDPVSKDTSLTCDDNPIANKQSITNSQS